MAYTEEDKKEIWNSIILELISGRSMRSIIKDPGMPDLSTFYDWLEKDEEKAKQYARACAIRADIKADEALDIANNTGDDIITLDDGKEVINHGVVTRDRLRVDAIKWYLSKIYPKKYGDRVDINNNHSGEILVTKLTPEQRKKRIDELKSKLDNDNR